MKKLILVIVLALSACVNHNIENIRPNEVGLGDNFSNRIFNISCRSSDVGPETVSKRCREYASKFALERGYLYFSVLDQSSNSKQSVGSYTTSQAVTTNTSSYGTGGYRYGTSTTMVPQTHVYSTTTNHKNYMFVLIEENELGQWNNYFRVMDYISE